jgi:hypothetical protein
MPYKKLLMNFLSCIKTLTHYSRLIVALFVKTVNPVAFGDRIFLKTSSIVSIRVLVAANRAFIRTRLCGIACPDIMHKDMPALLVAICGASEF